jgi:DASS family divalent anion:Na+ symporter
MPAMKKSWSILLCACVACVLWLFPVSSEIPKEGQEVFAIFIAVIVSFLLRPLPMGAMVLLSLIVLLTTKTIDMNQALSGYGDPTVWLVVAAFLISGAVVETGFGRRIALFFISQFGKNIFGVAYALCASELLLGPVVPSNTARGGGIHAPLARSLAEALKSHPDKDPDQAGSYLSLVGSHANMTTAGMFLTGMAANPLLAKAATEILNIEFGWMTWLIGTIVPGLVSLGLLPLFIYKMAPPTLRDTRDAQKEVRELYRKLGPWSRSEKWMATVFVLMILLWTTGDFHGMDTTLVAWVGVCILFLTDTLTWDRMIRNFGAWDALIWLGGLLTLATLLKDYGFVDWFASSVSGILPDTNAMFVLMLLALVYFFSMYLFSQLTAHIAAFIGGYFALASTYSIPPMTMVALFAGFSTLCGCLTPYASGPCIIYFGQGYVPLVRWFRVGFLVGIYHITIWFTVGMMWWKLLGWW